MSQADMLYDAQKKSLAVAYLFWFLFGMLGAHRFYLKRTRSGAAQLGMAVAGWMSLVLFIGAPLLVAVALWVLVDVALIPGMVREYNTKLATDLGSTDDAATVRIG